MADHARKRELIYSGRIFSVEKITLQMNGRTVTHDAVRNRDAVVVVAIDQDGRYVMIRNRRPVIDRVLWEFCAGGVEAGEDPAACAARELVEETGYRAARIEPLGSFYSSPGFCDELMHAFVATDLEFVGQQLESDEDIEVSHLSREDVQALIRSGELRDASSLVACFLLEQRNRGPNGNVSADEMRADQP